MATQMQPLTPFLPNLIVLTSGVGFGGSPLNAFDNALIAAGVGDLNLLRTSSIVPAGARIVNLQQSLEKPNWTAGTVIPAVYSFYIEDTLGETISVCLALGVVPRLSESGVIFEYSGRGTLKESRVKTQAMVAEAMAMRKRKNFDIVCVESEITITTKSFGCVVALAILGNTLQS